MAKKPTDRRLRKVIGEQAFHGNGPKPTARSMRVKAGKENFMLHAENLANPKVASGNGGFDDAADIARQKAFAEWRKAYAARTG